MCLFGIRIRKTWSNPTLFQCRKTLRNLNHISSPLLSFLQVGHNNQYWANRKYLDPKILKYLNKNWKTINSSQMFPILPPLSCALGEGMEWEEKELGNHSRSAQPLTGHLSATFVQGGGIHRGGLNSVPKCGSHSYLSWQVVPAADWAVVRIFFLDEEHVMVTIWQHLVMWTYVGA